jgi:hypothetical protein
MANYRQEIKEIAAGGIILDGEGKITARLTGTCK